MALVPRASGGEGVCTRRIVIMTRHLAARPLERMLAVAGDRLRCPRKGLATVAACEECPFLCRRDPLTSAVICSYPLVASDTFARRARKREDVRIALAQHGERT
jgi:hypothetical protein